MIKIDEYVTAEVKLYFDLHVPEGLSAPVPLLITVHGYAAHKKYMMREAKLIVPEGFAIASLEGPNRFWREASEGVYKPTYGWLTEQRSEDSIELHRRFVLDVIGKLVSDGTADPDRIFLHGFSQSCALNFKFAFNEPDVLKGIIGICGGIPSDLDANEGYSPTNADVLYLYSSNDQFYPLEKFRAFADKLGDYLPSCESKQYEAGHEITDEMRADTMEWLRSRM